MSELGPLARTDGLLTETVDREVLVYDLERDTAFHLNSTAALVWRSCDGSRTVAELAALVAEELGEEPNEDVVLMALDNLSDHGLIRSGYKERDGAAVALSRRRFFRRVGAVGAAALNAPVVYGMSVPIAAAALSTGASGQAQNDNLLFNNPSSSSRGSGSSSGGSSQSGGSSESDGSGQSPASSPSDGSYP